MIYDIKLICQISKFEDLETIGTFGFRGEALASISHVSHVTITTKTDEQPCAYRAKYLDGKLVPLKPGDNATPKPCAGVTGTIISVEDLFYNMLTRRQAFRNHKEEYQRVLDVVSKYAVHFGDKGIAFSCKRTESPAADLNTPLVSSTIDNIKIAYGTVVSRELIPFKCVSAGIPVDGELTDRYCMLPLDGSDSRPYAIDGYISNANYSSKKSICVIFINNRLVECNSLRKTIESVYANYLPKHTHPFIYIALRIPPQHVDVNVHPTKKEVHFLNEDALLGEVYNLTMQALCGANESRVFYTQTILATSSKVDSLLTRDTSSSSTTKELSDIGKATGINEENGDILVESEETENGSGREGSVDDENALSQPLRARTDMQVKPVASLSSPRSTSGSTSNKPTMRPHRAANKLVRTDPSASQMSQYFPWLSSTHPQPAAQGARRGDLSKGGVHTTAVESATCVCCAGDISGATAQQGEVQFCSLCSTQDIQEPTATSSRKRKMTFAVEKDVHVEDSEERSGENEQSGASRRIRQIETGLEVTSKAVVETLDLTAAINVGSGFNGRKTFPPLKRTSYDYESIEKLLDQIESACSMGVKSILKKHSMVGIVNAKYILVQHETKLLLLDHSMLALHLFYQLVLRRFGEMRSVPLSQAVDIREFVRCALDVPAVQWVEEDGSKEDISDAVATLLLSKGPMLEKYFGIGIQPTLPTGGAVLVSVPEVLEGYLPQPEGLPMFLLRLATETDWDVEINCFADVARELALFYSQLPTSIASTAASHSAGGDNESNFDTCVGICTEGRDVLMMQLLPAIQAYLSPCRTFMTDGTVVQVAALEQLYKVFERC